MRHRLLTGAVLALLAWPATGHAQSGGTSVLRPDRGRGLRRHRPRPHRVAASRSPRARSRPARRSASATASTAPGSSVRVRVELLPIGSRRPAARIRMGWKRTGRTLTRTWTPPAGALTPGDYVARLHAVDRSGRTLRRSATASGRSRLTVIAPAPRAAGAPAPVAPVVGSGIFPVRGAYTWGDALRRRPRHRDAPRAGHPRRRGHARRHAARGHRDLARLPGRGRRQLRRRSTPTTAATSSSCTCSTARSR